jgi:hypothetical protein
MPMLMAFMAVVGLVKKSSQASAQNIRSYG